MSIWWFLPSFNEFPHKLHILEISGATLSSNLQQEVSPAKLKYNETSPKLVYSQETSGTEMREKFQPILIQNAKVLNQYR